MTRVAIIAAMAGELKPLVRGWNRDFRNGVATWSRRQDECEWIAGCAGAGVQAAARALEEIERSGRIDCAYSVGWSGSLDGRHAAGRAYNVAGVIDAGTGERTPISGVPGECWLVTSPRVADRSEKHRLAAAYGASLVDMEAAGLASLARGKGIRFFCVKGVSDGLDDWLPDFNQFISSNGQFQMARFTAFAILRPWIWPTLIRMRGKCRDAAESIRDVMLRELPGRSHESGRLD